jgi:hypothetical protein
MMPRISVLRRKSLRIHRGVLAMSFLVHAAGLVPALQAREDCTNQDFIGAFGFFGTGHVIKSPVTILTGPFARLGRFESDGKGGLTFTSTASFNGHLLPQDFPGVYTMNSDCTFTAVVSLPEPINLPVTFLGVLSADGNEIRDLFVDPPGIVVYGTGRKQGLAECTNRELSGAYQLDLAGTTLQAGTARVPFSGLGRIVADGAGNFVGRLGSNYGGLAIPGEDISGTYVVASNCTFQLKYYTAGEGRTPEDGVTLKGSFIDNGAGAYVMVLQPTTATVLGSLRRQ